MPKDGRETGGMILVEQYRCLTARNRQPDNTLINDCEATRHLVDTAHLSRLGIEMLGKLLNGICLKHD
jgi:hypothetical protein